MAERILGDLLEFMTKEENRNWGLGLQDEGKIRFKEKYSLRKLAENYISLLRR